MRSNHPILPPLKRLWHIAREHLTSWAVAGVAVTLTGFTPDDWVVNLLQYLGLSNGFSPSFVSNVDFRLVAVGAGMALIAADVMVQNRKRRGDPAAAAAVSSIEERDNEDRNDIEDKGDKPSIAVLPFVNMSSDPEQEYFADGMTEDIITGLSYDSRLSVIARNSTFAYKGQSPDIRTVGKELGVRYVLEGSIRPAGDRLRITVQLIDTASGAHVWADKIDRPKAELFDIMDEVVDGLVTALCANLGIAESNRAKRQRPENLQAWALCVQAEVAFFTSQLDQKTLLEAEALARRAAEIEPDYAVSWALLGLFVGRRVSYGLSVDQEKDTQEALSLVHKALRLAPNDPIVLGYCGSTATAIGDSAEGLGYLERSLAINPNSSFSRLYYGGALNIEARSEEAIAQLELFLRRSPKDPYIGLAYLFLAYGHCFLGGFEQMEQAARKSVKHRPGVAWGYMVLAIALTALGRDAEAQAQMQKVRQLDPIQTRQRVEDTWRSILRKHEQAEKLISLTRQAWGE